MVGQLKNAKSICSPSSRLGGLEMQAMCSPVTVRIVRDIRLLDKLYCELRYVLSPETYKIDLVARNLGHCLHLFVSSVKLFQTDGVKNLLSTTLIKLEWKQNCTTHIINNEINLLLKHTIYLQ